MPKRAREDDAGEALHQETDVSAPASASVKASKKSKKKAPK